MNNIDKDKILKKLEIITTNNQLLLNLGGLSEEEFLEDFRNTNSAKYLLQVSIEAMLDIANHIISRNRWGRPESNKDSFELLYKNNIIEQADIDSYFNMAKFRNRIVHIYWDIDDKMIFYIIKNNIKDFEKFVNSITSVI